jgi:hypothetical protein
MTVQKTGPLVLLMFTVLCALPAAAVVVGVIPSAFAQEEEDDDTNTQIGVPLTDQDQAAANLGANLAANVDTERIIEEAQSATPPEEEEPPEFTVFCFVTENPPFGVSTLVCFDTLDECELGESSFLGPAIEGQECKGFVTQPPDSSLCDIREQGQATIVSCTVLPPPPP